MLFLLNIAVHIADIATVCIDLAKDTVALSLLQVVAIYEKVIFIKHLFFSTESK